MERMNTSPTPGDASDKAGGMTLVLLLPFIGAREVFDYQSWREEGFEPTISCLQNIHDGRHDQSNQKNTATQK
jgi:hypothetical protein